jgi:hypothetical protein
MKKLLVFLSIIFLFVVGMNSVKAYWIFDYDVNIRSETECKSKGGSWIYMAGENMCFLGKKASGGDSLSSCTITSTGVELNKTCPSTHPSKLLCQDPYGIYKEYYCASSSTASEIKHCCGVDANSATFKDCTRDLEINYLRPYVDSRKLLKYNENIVCPDGSYIFESSPSYCYKCVEKQNEEIKDTEDFQKVLLQMMVA